MAARMMAAGAMKAHREAASMSLLRTGDRARRTSPAVIVFVAMLPTPALLEDLLDLLGSHVERFLGTHLAGNEAGMLVGEHLLSRIRTRMADTPHLAFACRVIGLLQCVEHGHEPRLGRLGRERRLARREDAEVGRMPLLAFLR